MKCAIIGGGAAGFFTAITLAEKNSNAQVVIFDGAKQFLRKVKISGGGRCNVTHSCFDPKELIKNYPRGGKELRGAFHTWQPRDTVDWFESRGVKIKTEKDGRMFPVSDDSQSIINCLQDRARKAGVLLRNATGIKTITTDKNGGYELEFLNGERDQFAKVCLAVGSLKASSIQESIITLGHTIEPLAPSLFAFDIKDSRIQDLAGIAVKHAGVRLAPKGKKQFGPVLITHRGLSGPAILRLSAWEAREMEQANYDCEVEINWLGEKNEEQVVNQFKTLRNTKGDSFVRTKVFEEIPKRLWEKILNHAGVKETNQWAQLPKQVEVKLINELCNSTFHVRGKTMNKEEFVTCGGVRLKEVDFKRMESRIMPDLFFAGECLDYDGITGGFNFQAAWTTGHIAGIAMAG